MQDQRNATFGERVRALEEWRKYVGQRMAEMHADAERTREILASIERFTPAEWLDGQQRAQADANLAMALALLMGKPDGMVDLSSPRVGQALSYMAQIGVLTPERAGEIGAIAG